MCNTIELQFTICSLGTFVPLLGDVLIKESILVNTPLPLCREFKINAEFFITINNLKYGSGTSSKMAHGIFNKPRIEMKTKLTSIRLQSKNSRKTGKWPQTLETH